MQNMKTDDLNHKWRTMRSSGNRGKWGRGYFRGYFPWQDRIDHYLKETSEVVINPVLPGEV